MLLAGLGDNGHDFMPWHVQERVPGAFNDIRAL